jgi:putative effector of murein hydrolase
MRLNYATYRQGGQVIALLPVPAIVALLIAHHYHRTQWTQN